MKKCREKVVGDPVIKFVILDCSCMNYIDTQGVNCILDVSKTIFFDSDIQLKNQ